MYRHIVVLASILVAILLLCGCSPWENGEQTQTIGTVPLNSSHTVGQTFTSRNAGLSTISVHLKPSQPGSGDISLKLYHSPDKGTEIAKSDLKQSDVDQADWYDFNFSALPNSNNVDFYYELTYSGTGEISVSTAPGEAYLDGSLYWNAVPQDTQLAFKLSYSPRFATIGLFRESISWFEYLAIGAFLFVLPGWGVLSFFYQPWHRFRWSEKLALASGTSLAIYPVLFLWTRLFGINIGHTLAWAIPLAGGLLLIIKGYRYFRSNGWPTLRMPDREIIYVNTLLVILIVFLIISRVSLVRQIDIPLWGDSYQHSMISQLIADNNGLFNSWEPYADLQSFTYHFGFHTLVASFHWISSLPITASIIWVGQFLNILAILTLIPLANKVGGNSWAGIFAILFAGLITFLPQIYTNWGRYTQLAGLVILPIVVFIFWHYLENDYHWPTVFLLWVLFAGLALTHYRVLIMTLLFIPVIFVSYLKKIGARRLMRRILLAGIGGAVLFLPWFIHVFSGRILDIVGYQLGTPANQMSDFVRANNDLKSSAEYIKPTAWILLGSSLVWGFLRKNTPSMIIGSWWVLIILFANPAWMFLPGTGAISNFAVFISLYIPLGVLAGGAASWLIAWVEQSTKSSFSHEAIRYSMLILILALGYFGAQARSKDLDRQSHSLSTRPDQHAAGWIDANLPPDARFLVNSFFAYGGTIIAGSDGGWWLPLLAHRLTTQPPLNYGNEKGPIEGYVKWVNALQAKIQSKGINHPDVLAELGDRGISHVYIGQRGGRVGNGGDVLSLADLLNSPYYTLVYNQDRVFIFEVNQSP